jgi:hypothetical protein
MRSVLLALVVLLVVPGGATMQDDGTSGIALLRDCEESLRASGDFSRAMYCSGVVEGTARTLMFLDRESALTGMRVCLPADVTGDRLVQVVLRYLSEHPADLHLPDVELVTAALRHEYSC